MSFRVYGIRLQGDTETRYIGQTSGPPRVRLSSHRCWNSNPAFLQWLNANNDRVEVFEITQCASRKEALSMERLAIQLCLKFNHRLFNREHVPHELRLAA